MGEVDDDGAAEAEERRGRNEAGIDRVLVGESDDVRRSGRVGLGAESAEDCLEFSVLRECPLTGESQELSLFGVEGSVLAEIEQLLLNNYCASSACSGDYPKAPTDTTEEAQTLISEARAAAAIVGSSLSSSILAELNMLRSNSHLLRPRTPSVDDGRKQRRDKPCRGRVNWSWTKGRGAKVPGPRACLEPRAEGRPVVVQCTTRS